MFLSGLGALCVPTLRGAWLGELDQVPTIARCFFSLICGSLIGEIEQRIHASRPN